MNQISHQTIEHHGLLLILILTWFFSHSAQAIVIENYSFSEIQNRDNNSSTDAENSILENLFPSKSKRQIHVITGGKNKIYLSKWKGKKIKRTKKNQIIKDDMISPLQSMPASNASFVAPLLVLEPLEKQLRPTSAVPEPSVIALFLLGLGMLVFRKTQI